MADQTVEECAVCRDELVVASVPTSSDIANDAPSLPTTPPDTLDPETLIAEIQPCKHILHDACLRPWAEGNANTCPLCRGAFNLVHVFDKVNGTKLSEYTVKNKRQVAVYDEAAFFVDTMEEEATPCLVCNLADREHILLLCDRCDSPYHTECVGLAHVPEGSWFCGGCEVSVEASTAVAAESTSAQTSGHSRTAQSARRARRREMINWTSFSETVTNIRYSTGVEIEFSEEDEELAAYRSQQEFNPAQLRNQLLQRIRQRNSPPTAILPRTSPSRQIYQSGSRSPPAERPPQPSQRPPTPPETLDERRAWLRLSRARQEQNNPPTTTRSRKRKASSTPASPPDSSQDTPAEGQRKQKRPRAHTSARPGSSSGPNPTTARHPAASITARAPAQPSFISGLLDDIASGGRTESD